MPPQLNDRQDNGDDDQSPDKNFVPLPCPSLAQTHMQGPLINGSGKSLTAAELSRVKLELETIKTEFGLREPERMFMDDPCTLWMFDGVPDYSLTNYLFLTQRTKCHAAGSLEETVENLVKTWEMERSHKPDCSQHMSTAGKDFRFSANGGKVFDNVTSHQAGNYNVLLDTCPKDLYDASKLTFAGSHDKFHKAFAAFPWELLDVYSPPPKVAFSWRHWAHFTGEYEGNKGKGELVELFGFCTATVNDKLQIVNLEVYFDAAEFISVLKGLKKPKNANASWKGNCPVSGSGVRGGGCPHFELMKQQREKESTKSTQKK